MEFLPFLAGILFLILLVKMGRRRKTNGQTVHLPPGPSKLPFIGSLHHLVGSLPHYTLRDMANKHGALMHLQLGEVSAVVISSAEIAKEALVVNQTNFASRPSILCAEIVTYNYKDIICAPYGEYWRQLRKICNLELLSAKRVKSFWPLRQSELTRLMKMIASNEGLPINISKEVDSSIHTITSKAAFGQKIQHQEQFINIITECSELAGGFNIADLYPSVKWLHYVTGVRMKVMKLHQQADKIMEEIIDQHEMKNTKKDKEGGDQIEAEDLLDVLLRYQHPNEDNFYLTRDHIKAVIMNVFGAGSDTSSAVIEWAMSNMMKNPRVMLKAQTEVREVIDRIGEVCEMAISEMHYLKLVVKETLRVNPSGPLLLPRENQQSCKLGGYDIPMKTKVIVNVWAIGRDPKYWTDPENFYPERFIDNLKDYKGTDLEYIPFGAGRRICPGITYGIGMVENVLAFLLYHFDWELPAEVKNEDLDMSETFGAVVKRKHDLELIPTVRRPLT